MPFSAQHANAPVLAQTSTLHLFERFEALGAKKVSKWKTLTMSYTRKTAAGTPGPDRDKVASDVFLVQFPTDTPDKVYTVARLADEDKVMEAGAGFLSIWQLINPTGGVTSNALYEQKVSMTVDGWSYDLGDLIVRVGSIVVRNQPAAGQQGGDGRGGRSESFKGAVLEIEYLPSVDKQDSMQLISEFIEVYCSPDGPTAVAVPSFRPVTNIVPTKGNGSANSLHWPSRSKEYTNEHRAQQYVALFHQVVKPPSSSAGSTGQHQSTSHAGAGSASI